MRLQLKNIDKKYGDKSVISNLNLDINSGELVSIVGPSGCGKSTTLYMISGLEEVTKGKIIFEDKDVTNISADKREIGLVFQNYALYPHLTVFKNILFPLTNTNISKEEAAARTNEIIEAVGLNEHRDKFPGELSGGQQQRVAIARAIVKRPKVLLLDEPLSNLDAKLKMSTILEIKRIQRMFNITTIFVTHDQQEAMAISDRMIILKDGNAAQVGLPNELYRKPSCEFVATFIGSPSINMINVEVVNKKIVGLEKLVRSEINLKDGKYKIGVRPEAFYRQNNAMEFDITDTEILGRDVLLYSRNDTVKKIKILIANTNDSFNEEITNISVCVDAKDIHFFDINSGDLVKIDE